MKVWLRQHRFALADAFARVRRMPGSFLFNVLVVAIALTLPFAGLTLMDSIRPVSDELAVEPEISIFMALDTPREKATALAAEIRQALQQHQLAGRLEFIPRETALNNLKDRTGLTDTLATLGSNPLPDGYILRLAQSEQGGDTAGIEALAASLKVLPGVEHVQVDTAWVKRLAALLQLFRLLLVLLASTLAVVVVAVVFNTIRLQVMTQRAEIEVSRLVGATDAFIYRPFYYSGALLGLGAGMLALGGIAVALQPLNQAIAEFAQLYGSDFRIQIVSIPMALLLLAGSASLGYIGALLSVRRHLVRLS